MAKKYLLIVLFISISFSGLWAQKISNVDFDEIKGKTTDSLSEFYYPKLLQLFEKGATFLSKAKLKALYYGYVFTKDYSPYGPEKEDEDEMLKSYKKGDFKNAILAGKRILEKDPTDLIYNKRIALCYFGIKDTVNAEKYVYRYVYLENIIYESGDGKSIETAYVVTKVSDEYHIMGRKKLDMVSQELLVGDFDLIKFKIPNEENIKELYFNVKFPLEYMGKMIERSNK